MATSKQQSKASLTSSPPNVDWDLITPGGPVLCNHAGAIVNGTLYVHGGINKKLSKEPLRSLYSFDLKGSQIWQEVQASNPPALSHHACVTMKNRYLIFIGGWDGRIRTTKVFIFDAEKKEWLEAMTTGFPEGGGLSSHTAISLSSDSILICGRDGSTRTHRRHGDVYLLSGDVQKRHFTYSRYPMDVESRSGHTAHVIDSSLYIVGGRADKTIEIHKGFKCISQTPSILSALASKVKHCQALSKQPCGRKQHISAAGHGIILVHGGETFDGRSRDPVGEIFIVRCKPSIEWIKLTTSDVCRSGHLCCVDSDSIIIHGGMGKKGLIHCDLYQLKIL